MPDLIRYLLAICEDLKDCVTPPSFRKGRSFGIGLGIGALFGGILGYSTGDWDSEPAGHPDSQAYFSAVLFGLMGGGVGLIAGVPSNYHVINGDQHNYLKHKEKFHKYAIIKK